MSTFSNAHWITKFSVRRKNNKKKQAQKRNESELLTKFVGIIVVIIFI